jgi:hypothetical protein
MLQEGTATMSETATEPTPPALTEPPAPADPPAQQQPPATGQEPAAQPAASADELPSWAQRELKKLRDEAANHRVKANEASAQATAAVEQMRADQASQRLAWAKALGLAPEEPPTAEQLTEKLTAAQAAAAAERDRARAAAVELAVLRSASRQQANGDALLDSRTFASQLTGLDPAAADFAQQVDAAITTAVEANPGWKLAAPTPAAPAAPAPPAVPQSGTGPITGVPDGPRQWTQADVDRASPAEVQKAMDDGLLQSLGFGTARKRRR